MAGTWFERSDNLPNLGTFNPKIRSWETYVLDGSRAQNRGFVRLWISGKVGLFFIDGGYSGCLSVANIVIYDRLSDYMH